MPKKKTAAKPDLPKIFNLVTCDAVSRDPTSGKVSLYGLFGKVIAENVPTDPIPFGVHASIQGGSGKHTAVFEIKDPDGQTIEDSRIEFTLSCKPRAAGDLMGRGAMVFEKYGEYNFVFRIGRKRMATRTVIVTKPAKKTAAKKRRKRT